MTTKDDIRNARQKVPEGSYYHTIPRGIVVRELIDELEATGKYRNIRERKP